MLLVIDYDDTYTLDPVFWDDMIHNAQTRGHTVVCCTASTRPEVVERMSRHLVDVLVMPTESNKWDTVESKYTMENVVWIDDKPEVI